MIPRAASDSSNSLYVNCGAAPTKAPPRKCTTEVADPSSGRKTQLPSISVQSPLSPGCTLLKFEAIILSILPKPLSVLLGVCGLEEGVTGLCGLLPLLGTELDP